MAAPTAKRKTASSSPPSGKHDPAQSHRQAYEHRKARAKAKSETLRRKEAARVEALPVQHPHAAGIDIGSRSHWVCVGFGTDVDLRLIQEFPAHTAGLIAIVAFLREHQVNTVALESTGIYWVPLYELLQAEGFELYLARSDDRSATLTRVPKVSSLCCFPAADRGQAAMSSSRWARAR
jgi:hypothetical protein